LHLVGILFPHINDDAWSKSHQICMRHTRLLSSGFKFEPLNCVPTVMTFTVIALFYEI